MPVIIRAMDNGEPPTFVREQLRISMLDAMDVILDGKAIHSECIGYESTAAQHHVHTYGRSDLAECR